MNFSTNVKDLASAVTAASKVVATKTTVPILENVLISASDGSVTVRATDLETTLEHSFSAEVHVRGGITVPAKLLASYLGKLPAGIVSLDATKERLGVKCGRSTSDFHGLPADEFPPLPPRIAGSSFSVPGKAFCEAVDAVVFAASDESTRGAVLQGTLLQIAGDALTLVSTDGYRLARREITLSGPVEGWGSKIVPAQALAGIARLLSDADTIDVCALGERSQVRFSAGSTSIVARLVDGTYPNYAQVIPTRFDRSAIVNTAAFIGALKRAELIAGDKASMVTVKIANDLLIVTASSNESGNAYEELEIEQTGDDITVAFNAKFLIEILSHVKTPQVVLEFIGPLSPVAIKPTDKTQQLHVLMPLRQ